MSTIAPLAPAVRAATTEVPTMPIYRLSVAQYEAMARHGILGPEDRVELLHGWLVPKMTKHTPHTMACALLIEVLVANKPAGWHLRMQDPVRLDDSVPEPDAMLVSGGIRDFDAVRGQPGGADVGLVVEVADSSLLDDRAIKGPLYAGASIPTYWIVNVVENWIEVYTLPIGPIPTPSYGQRQDYHIGEEIPLFLGGQEVARIPVSELLP